MKEENPDIESEDDFESDTLDREKSKRKSTRYSIYDKFEKALEMDANHVPRSTIFKELDISSATLYKWIRNPEYWKDQYKAKPDRLKRTTKEIVRSVKSKETSMETVRGLMKDLQLNEYELEFVYNYIQRRNTTEAMLRTLPPDVELSKQAAKIKALKLMQRPRIRTAIDMVLQWELEGIHVTLANDIIGNLYRMAFYDPAMFINIDDRGVAVSRFKSLDDVPEEYRCCVLGFKNTFHPKDPKRVYVEIQLVNRMEAMKELMQYANLYEDNNKGLKSIGEGLSKIAALMDKNKLETIPGNYEDIQPAEKA